MYVYICINVYMFRERGKYDTLHTPVEGNICICIYTYTYAYTPAAIAVQ